MVSPGQFLEAALQSFGLGFVVVVGFVAVINGFEIAAKVVRRIRNARRNNH